MDLKLPAQTLLRHRIVTLFQLVASTNPKQVAVLWTAGSSFAALVTGRPREIALLAVHSRAAIGHR